MTLSGSKYALAATERNGRKMIVEITSGPNSKGELSCTTGGRTYLIHGSKLRPLTSRAAEILQPFAASTATKTYLEKN